MNWLEKRGNFREYVYQKSELRIHKLFLGSESNLIPNQKEKWKNAKNKQKASLRYSGANGHSSDNNSLRPTVAWSGHSDNRRGGDDNIMG